MNLVRLPDNDTNVSYPPSKRRVSWPIKNMKPWTHVQQKKRTGKTVRFPIRSTLQIFIEK